MCPRLRELAPKRTHIFCLPRYIPKEGGWMALNAVLLLVRSALLTAPFRSCLHPPPNESETRPQDQKERERGSPEVCTFPNGFARLELTRSHACKNAVIFAEFSSFRRGQYRTSCIFSVLIFPVRTHATSSKARMSARGTAGAAK